MLRSGRRDQREHMGVDEARPELEPVSGDVFPDCAGLASRSKACCVACPNRDLDWAQWQFGEADADRVWIASVAAPRRCAEARTQ